MYIMNYFSPSFLTIRLSAYIVLIHRHVPYSITIHYEDFPCRTRQMVTTCDWYRLAAVDATEHVAAGRTVQTSVNNSNYE